MGEKKLTHSQQTGENRASSRARFLCFSFSKVFQTLQPIKYYTATRTIHTYSSAIHTSSTCQSYV